MTVGEKAKEPSVPLEEFERICRDEPAKVYVSGEAEKDARNDFKIITKEDLKSFIGNKGVESPEHVSTELWHNNPLKDTHPSYVDAFIFKTGTKSGYLAYCPNPRMKNWLLKSFKLNIVNANNALSTLEQAFIEAGFGGSKKEDKNE